MSESYEDLSETDKQRLENLLGGFSATDYNRGKKDAISSGAKIRGKIKRGTGTRDQDEIVIEGRGASAVEAAQDFEQALQMAEEHGWTQRLRDMQPDGDGDG